MGRKTPLHSRTVHPRVLGVMAAPLPVIPVLPRELHAQPIVDFSDEENVKKHVRANRWLALDAGSFRICRFNWVVFALASIVL